MIPVQKWHRLVPISIALVIAAWCAWYLYTQFQWPEVFAILRHAKPAWLLLGGGVMSIVYIFLRTWRWLVMVRVVNPKARFWDLYWITAVVVNLAIITPGQLGETLKVEMLKRQGILDRTPGLGSFLMERIIDLVIVAGLAVIGLLAGTDLFLERERQKLLWILVAMATTGLGGLWLLLRIQFRGNLGRLLRRLRQTSGGSRMWLRVTLLSLISWMVVALGWQFSLRSVDICLSIPQSLWLMSLTTIAQVLSFIPGGLGIAEVVTVKILEPMGYGAALAQAGAVILRCYGLVIIASGLLHLLVWRITRKQYTSTAIGVVP